MSRITAVNKASNNGIQAAVTNGDMFVSLVVDSGSFGVSAFVVTLTPERATDLAIGLLNAAMNVRNGVHGNNEARYDDNALAHKALVWEPPVEVPGELVTLLVRSFSQGESDRKAVIGKIKKAIGR